VIFNTFGKLFKVMQDSVLFRVWFRQVSMYEFFIQQHQKKKNKHAKKKLYFCLFQIISPNKNINDYLYHLTR